MMIYCIQDAIKRVAVFIPYNRRGHRMKKFLLVFGVLVLVIAVVIGSVSTVDAARRLKNVSVSAVMSSTGLDVYYSWYGYRIVRYEIDVQNTDAAGNLLGEYANVTVTLDKAVRELSAVWSPVTANTLAEHYRVRFEGWDSKGNSYVASKWY